MLLLGLGTAPVFSRSEVYLEEFYGGRLIRKIDTNQKIVALTFDDGPDPVYTPQILEFLKARRLKADFFLMGKHARQYPEIVRRMAEEGQEIGNHTYSHPDLLLKREYTVREEIEQCDRVIFDLLGVKPLLFRPPYGLEPQKAARECNALGHLAVDWNISPRDWARPGVNKMLERILKRLAPGSIILLHDGGGDRSQTVALLPPLIEQLKKRGYRILTVEAMLEAASQERPKAGDRPPSLLP